LEFISQHCMLVVMIWMVLWMMDMVIWGWPMLYVMLKETKLVDLLFSIGVYLLGLWSTLWINVGHLQITQGLVIFNLFYNLGVVWRYARTSLLNPMNSM
jgi:hypothetical protein